jgi:hypothetical protein
MRTIVIILTVLFSSSFLFGQTHARVNSVRQWVEKINNDTLYTVKKLENEQWMEQMTDGGGELTGYFKDGQLVKIVEWVGLSSCISIYEYYFHNNSLIFVYGEEKDFKYNDSTATFDANKQTVAMECRYYFDNDKLIRAQFIGSPRCGTQPTEADAPHLIAESKQFAAQLEKRR